MRSEDTFFPSNTDINRIGISCRDRIASEIYLKFIQPTTNPEHFAILAEHAYKAADELITESEREA